MEKKRIALMDPDDDDSKKIQLTPAQRDRIVLEFLLKSKKLSEDQRRELEFLRLQQAIEEAAQEMTDFFTPFLESEESAKLVMAGLKKYHEGRLKKKKRTQKRKK